MGTSPRRDGAVALPFAYRSGVSEAYFPDACFGDRHAQRAEWFERNLRALGEPSLWASRDERSGLRVLRLPTWKGATATRIEWSPSSVLSYRVCDGMAGFEPVGELRVSRDRPLPPRRLERLRRAIDATRFFDVPTNERQRGPRRRELDRRAHRGRPLPRRVAVERPGGMGPARVGLSLPARRRLRRALTPAVRCRRSRAGTSSRWRDSRAPVHGSQASETRSADSH